MLLEDIGGFPIGTAYEFLDPSQETTLPPQSPEDRTALKIVVQDAAEAEKYVISSGLLREWMNADRLYLFKVPQYFWEGTNPPLPRANLGMPLVYEHVESILPQVMLGLFSDDPPFALKPKPGTSMNAARATQAVLAYQLDRAGFREQLRIGIKFSLVYGTGIFKWGWKETTRKKKVYERKVAPTLKTIGDGAATITIRRNNEIRVVEKEETISEPTFEYVNPRHILVDPNLRQPDIRKARYVIHRAYMTVPQVLELSEYEGYEIPDQAKLIKILFPPKEEAPQSPLESSAINPNKDFEPLPRNQTASVDPLNQPLEVLEYWTKDRVYTVVNRKLVIRNTFNEFEEIPFCSLHYGDIPDTFWSLGIAKLVGGEQRMQQGVINAFLDDLALSLNGMFIRRRGSNVPNQQLRMRPGGFIEADVPDGRPVSDAVGLLPRQPVQVEVFKVLADSDSRAQRRTAANELVVQGSLPANQSSITRTATGVQALSGGAGARLQIYIENLANNVFVPTLRAFHKMTKERISVDALEALLTQELGAAYQDDPIDLVNADFDFDIIAASKLQARRAMAQSLPMLFQFVLTEPVMQGLAEQGKKVNVEELVNMLFDVSGWPNQHDVIVDMTEEDQARQAMNNPAVQQLLTQRAQMQQQHSNKLDLIEEENIGRAGRDVLQSILKGALEQGMAPKETNGSKAK